MTKHTFRSIAPMILAAVSAGLMMVGCASGAGPTAPVSTSSTASPNSAVVSTEQPVVSTEEARPVASAPVAVTANAEENGAALRSVEVRYLTDRAGRELAAGNLAEARRTVDEALELAPQDAGLLEMSRRVNAAANARPSAAPGSPEAEALSTLGEYLIEADRIWTQAQNAEAASDWRGAEGHYRRLRELIQFAPYKAELRDKYEARTLAGLHNAQIELRRQRDREDIERSRSAARLQQIEIESREQRQREQIVELWRQALYQLELRNFNRATELVNQILHIDREFHQAAELRIEIDQLRLQNLRRDVYERKMLGYRQALLEIRMAMVPDQTIVTYPTGRLAREIVERKNNLTDTVRLDRDTLAIQSQLDSTTVALNFSDGQTLGDVIRFIRNEAGVNVLLAEGLAEREVNIELANIPLSAALNIICEQHGLKQVYAYGVLTIAESSEDISEEMVTRVHDVRDITYQIQDFAGPVLQLRSGNDMAGTTSFDFGGDPQIEADEIVDFIQSGVDPDTWVDGTLVEIFGGQLVVTHTAAMQAKIRDFLNDLRRVAGLLVAIEARFISIQDDFLSDFGIDFRGLGGPASVPNQANLTLEDVSSNAPNNAGGAFDNGNLGIPTASPSAGIFFNSQDPAGPVNFNRDIMGRFENIFDNSLGSRLSNIGGMAMQVAIFQNLTQINAVIQAVQKKGRARTLVSPRLSAFNTQRSNIAIINQVPYIRDFEVQSAAAAAIANPVMDTVLDGIVFEVVPTISNDRRFITIEVQPTIAELLVPINTFVTTLGPSSAVTIQVPEVRVQSAKTTVRVPDGGAVVIGGLKTARDIDRMSGTPILSDIPLIGVLFRRKGRSIEQSNLVIVIKAHVIDLNDEELRQPGWH
jgi:type IV pilus assembly protein PilQ